jgi:hypothetical protein
MAARLAPPCRPLRMSERATLATLAVVLPPSIGPGAAAETYPVPDNPRVVVTVAAGFDS